MYEAITSLRKEYSIEALCRALGVSRSGYYDYLNRPQKEPSARDLADIEQYMNKHLSFAGVGRDIFSESAIDEVFSYSSGTSRLINKLATHCLLFAAQNGNCIIDDRMVKKVIEGELA